MARRTLPRRSHTSDKAVLLLRVSTKKQLDTAIDIDPDGLSIATQRDQGNAKADAMGVEVATEFIEPGYSAKTIDKRPVFRELLKYLAEHPEVRYVIVYMRSRAFRNRFDAAIIEAQLNKMGVRLVSAKEDFGEGPHAVAMEGMLDVMNHLMNTLQGLDIQEKMRTKAVNGGTLGIARIGYLNVRVEYEGKLINTVAQDERRAPLVCKAFELYATGRYGLELLEATMTDLGLTARPIGKWPERPVSFKRLHQMLQDPYYAGWIEYEGELYPGRHEPIVTQELFDRVQDVMDMRSRLGQRDRVLQHYLKGDLFCDRCHGAGRTSRVIYTEAKSHNGSRYSYFLCRGRQDGQCDLPYLPAGQVEQAILDHYSTLQLPCGFVIQVREVLETALAEEQSGLREMHNRLKKQLKELDAKEERLLDLAIDNAMPQPKIKARLRKIQNERTSIETRLTATHAELAVGVEVLVNALDLLSDPQELYENGSDVVRRHLNQTFYQCFYLDIDGVKADQLNEPFAGLHEVGGTRRTFHQGLTRSPRPSRRSRNAKGGPTLSGVPKDPGSSKTTLVELPGIEPGSSAASSGLLRVQFARSLLGSPGLANKLG